MTATDRLLDLLELWEDQRQSGPEPTAEQLCPDDPTLCAELRERIARRRRLLALIDVPDEPLPMPGLPSVPGYEVLSELGRGGMGVVYLARHVGLNRQVALKMIAAGSYADAETRARFQAEARAVARLRHPNIVQIHDVGEHQGQPFLALEYVEGGSLADHLGGEPQPPGESAALVAALADAVHHAHQAGIIHRDLKPANVLLSFSRHAAGVRDTERTPAAWRLNEVMAKITDFGLAKDRSAEVQRTQTGALLGTPAYMAPEQASGQKDLTGAVDVYALGVILYECLTGRPPFQGVHLADTLDRVRHSDPLPPRRLQPAVSRNLETICLKCLTKEPARRYATAGDLAADLCRFRDGRPILARPTPVWEHAVKWAWRRPAAAALIAVSLLAVGTLLGVSLSFNAALVQQRDKAQRNLGLAVMTSGALARLARSADVDPSPESVASLREAIDVFERLTAEYPDEPDYHDQLGTLYYIRNKQDKTQETFDKALAASRRAVELWDRRRAERPHDPERRNALARGLHNLGDLLAARGKTDDAEPLIRRALELRDGLVAETGPAGPYAVELALTQVLMGRFLFYLRHDLDGALDWSQRAFPVLERDIASAQPHPMSRSRWADAHGVCGMILDKKEDYEGALAHWDAALTDPTMVGRLRFLYRNSRAYILTRLGRYAEAAKETIDLSRSPSAAGGLLLYPAETFAFAAAAVLKDSSLSPADRDRLAEEYGRQSVALLKRAADQNVFATPDTVAGLKADPEWAVLRDRPDFQALLASLSSPTP